MPPVNLLDQLIAQGLLIPGGVDGVYGRGAAFERVVDGLERAISRIGFDAAPGDDNGLQPCPPAEVMRFPPGMSRSTFEHSEYLKGFPQFAGTIHSFCGDERGHRELLRCIEVGEDWTAQQRPTDLVLTPAACYPVYATLQRRGKVPQTGWLVDVASYCFRREPSIEPTRMQMFRQREYVRVGTPAQVEVFRQEALRRSRELMARLGLPCAVEVANDPFFGRVGTLMANNQRAQELKFEFLIPVNEGAGPTACGSVNYHLDHFAVLWDLETDAGERCHTACCAFGLERLTLALFAHHGLAPGSWPPALQNLLWDLAA